MNSGKSYLSAVATAIIACSVTAYVVLQRALEHAVIYW